MTPTTASSTLAARLYGEAPRPAPTPDDAAGPDLAGLARSFADTLREGEETAISGLAGKADALAAEGLLDYAPNRGFTVRTYSPETIAEAYEIRAVLEGLASRLAARRPLSPDLAARFEAALAEGDAIVEGFDDTQAHREAYRSVNVAFHDAVIAAAGNQMLEDTLRLALARPATTLRNIVSFTEQHVRRRHDDHHRIHEAIRAGDGWRAELLMREHVTSVKVTELERQGAR